MVKQSSYRIEDTSLHSPVLISRLPTKIIFFVLSLFILLLGFIFYHNYLKSRDLLIFSIENNFKERAISLDASIYSVVKHVKNMRFIAEQSLSQTMEADLAQIYQSKIKHFTRYQQQYKYAFLHPEVKIGTLKVSGTLLWGDISLNTGQSEHLINQQKWILLGLELFPIQEAEHKNNKNIALSYYVSKNNHFISTYPDIKPENIISEFVQEDPTKNASTWIEHAFEVYDNFAPIEKNPERAIFWTNPYLDRAGNGMMVTCAIPVDNDSNLAGVLGADIVLKFIDPFTAPIEVLPGQMILSTQFYQVISATDLSYKNESDIVDLDTLLSFEINDSIPIEGSQTLSMMQDKVIFSYSMKNAPWKLIYVVSEKSLNNKIYFEQRSFFILTAMILILFGSSYYFFSKRYIQPGIKAEKERKKSEQRLNLAMAVANDGIWDWHLDTNQVFFDANYYTLSGYEVNAFPSTLEEWEKRIHPDDINQTKAAFTSYLSGESDKYDTEFRFLCQDEHYMWIRARGKIFHHDKNGAPLQFIGTHSDISIQKRIESRLINAQKNSEKSNQAKSEFLAKMSHEIRTPLSAIIGMTHLALQTELNPEQHNYIDKVSSSSELLLGIIDDILDFSKIEAGKLDIEKISFKLNDVINHLQNLISIMATQKNISLHIDVPEHIPLRLIGDSLRLGQVLLNIAANAVKFTHSGGEVLITVMVEEEDENEVLLHFSIHDNGIGITSEQQKKLFQSFSQADSSTTRHHGGTGLGLAISKKLVELMGGEIWLESKLNSGSTFHFTIIFEKQHPQTITTTLNRLGSEKYNEKIKLLKGLQILLVEDNELNQEFALTILRKNGLNVHLANNGQEALDILSKESFDCVLMDCHMPVMDGCTASRKIRQQEQYKQLPIIAMTANVINNERDKIFSAGMNDYISKPVNIKKMFQTIAKWTQADDKKSDISHHNKHIGYEISGINTQSGFALCGYDHSLYEKLLNLFYNNQIDFEQKLNSAYADNDYKEIKMLAHTLKGASATIGANKLQDAATKLETACQSRDNKLTPYITSIISELKIVLAGIKNKRVSIK